MNRELYEQMKKYFDLPFGVHDCPSIHSCGFTYLTTYENDAAAEKLIDWYAAHRPYFKGRITHAEEKSTLVISRKKR